MLKLGRDNWIVMGILAAMIAGAAVLVYLPQSRELSRLTEEIARQKANMDADIMKASVVPDMVRQIEDMKNRYKDFDRRLPKRKELSGFLREISGHLAAEKISNQLIEPGKPKQEELFHTLPIIMRFEGSYLAMVAFLERVRKMERFTRVQDLTATVRPENAGKDAGKAQGDCLDVDLRMNIYFTES